MVEQSLYWPRATELLVVLKRISENVVHNYTYFKVNSEANLFQTRLFEQQ